MGLGFDTALGMLDFAGNAREATLARARQRPEVSRTTVGGTETGLIGAEAREYFDATRLDVTGELEVADGRFSTRS